MQTKFSALVPTIVNEKNDLDANPRDSQDFWHSFFLLKPEFLIMQTTLSANYSIPALRTLIQQCLDTIGKYDASQVSKMQRSNASYLLVQIFESLWPRIRAGTFGVDAINILCGLDNADEFFNSVFRSILSQKDSDPALVLLSILSATRDVETNALTDFFTQKCDGISDYCWTASDLHLLLFSLLLQLDRPSGQYIQHFRSKKVNVKESRMNQNHFKNNHNSKEDDKNVFISLVTNLIARSAQLYICCKPKVKSFFQRAVSQPSVAKLGLFVPSDFPMPMCFVIFEPFIDSSILCFYELSVEPQVDRDPSLTQDEVKNLGKIYSPLISSALSLLTFVAASPSTPHAGDRLRMLLVSFAFLFDVHPSFVSYAFDHKQFQACFNPKIAECRECTIGAMALEIVSYLLSMKESILPIAGIIGRIIYTILSTFIQFRGNHNVKWRLLFDSIFGFCRKTIATECEFNGYAVAVVAICSSFRAALFKKDDGYISMIQALAKDPSVAACNYEIPEALSGAAEFLKKCHIHVQKLSEALGPEVADMQDAQVETLLQNIKVEDVNHKLFPHIEKLSECPTFTQFFHIYARQHCENIQAFLQYTVSHI